MHGLLKLPRRKCGLGYEIEDEVALLQSDGSIFVG